MVYLASLGSLRIERFHVQILISDLSLVYKQGCFLTYSQLEGSRAEATHRQGT